MLKPCKFCGNRPVFEESIYPPHYYHLRCYCNFRTEDAETYEKDADIWNAANTEEEKDGER